MYRVFLALRYLRSRLVNLISVGGVAAGVAVLIVVVAIMDGFQERVRKVARGNLSDLTMFPVPAPDGVGNGEWPPPFTDMDKKIRGADERVEATAPQMRVVVGYFHETRKVTGGFVHQGKQVHIMEATGIIWDRERQVSDLERNLLAAHDYNDPFRHPLEERGKRTVLISRRFAEVFFGVEDGWQRLVDGAADLPLHVLVERSDGSLNPDSYNLVISGVYDGQDATQDINRVFIELPSLREMANRTDEYTEIKVRLQHTDQGVAAKKVMNDTFPGFDTVTWEDQQRTFLQAVENEKVLLVIVLSFIVLLGGFIILATLTLTVVEKTRDIGILGALGASRTGVLTVFLWTGLLIGILGSLIGLGLGYWFTMNVNEVKDFLKSAFDIDIFPQEIYRFRDIPTVWDWPSCFKIMTGSTLMAFFAGFLPALRAARQDPIKALRHE